MSEQVKTVLTVQSTINAPVEKVWEYWNGPEHIVKWAAASDDWHTTKAENDLRVGGRFVSRMEAKDGSFGFDFGGIYDEVRTNEYIAYTLGDSRKVNISFSQDGDNTTVVENFDAEQTHPVEMQQAGWQAIMDNFKKYTETA
jgi:uncharacterized protein YndB with AHSA1/START domain